MLIKEEEEEREWEWEEGCLSREEEPGQLQARGR